MVTGVPGCNQGTWKNWKFQMEIQMVHHIPFGKLQLLLGGVYMRKLAPAWVLYRDDFLISYRVYMMTGSFHISLFEGTLHADKIHKWFKIANITHALPVPVYRQIDFRLVCVTRLTNVWEMSTEIPYWWRVTTQIRVVLLIHWREFHQRHDQSEAVPHLGHDSSNISSGCCLRNSWASRAPNFLLLSFPTRPAAGFAIWFP